MVMRLFSKHRYYIYVTLSLKIFIIITLKNIYSKSFVYKKEININDEK